MCTYIFVHLAMVHTCMSVLALCVLVCCSRVYMCTMHGPGVCACVYVHCTVGGCNTCVCAHAMFAVSFVLAICKFTSRLLAMPSVAGSPGGGGGGGVQ